MNSARAHRNFHDAGAVVALGAGGDHVLDPVALRAEPEVEFEVAEATDRGKRKTCRSSFGVAMFSIPACRRFEIPGHFKPNAR